MKLHYRVWIFYCFELRYQTIAYYIITPSNKDSQKFSFLGKAIKQYIFTLELDTEISGSENQYFWGTNVISRNTRIHSRLTDRSGIEMCIMFKYRAKFFIWSGKDFPDYSLTFLVRRCFTDRGEFPDAFATPVCLKVLFSARASTTSLVVFRRHAELTGLDAKKRSVS